MDKIINNTGFLKSPKDYRDFKLSACQKETAIPEVFKPDYSYLPTYHQHKQPSCIGHAVTWMINFNEWTEIQSKDELSPRFIYALAKRDDGVPYEDGTFYRIGLKEAQRYGVPDDALFPNDTDLDRETYNNYKLIDSHAYENAELRKIRSYVQVDNLSFNGIKQAIYQNKVVLLAIQVDENMYTDRFGNITWKEKDILPLRLPVADGGHAVVGIGYDKDYIYFQNSWGTEWGAYGVGYIGKNYIPYIKEAWTVIDLPNDKIAELKAAQKSLIGILKMYVGYLTEKLANAGKVIARAFRE